MIIIDYLLIITISLSNTLIIIIKFMFNIAFLLNIMYYIIILNLSLLISFLRLFSILADVTKVAKTLTFETSLISFSKETGVFTKPIAIELPSHQ